MTGTNPSSDRAAPLSITRHIGSKAQIIEEEGASIYVNDQYQVCADVLKWQCERSYWHRVSVIQATLRGPFLLSSCQKSVGHALRKSSHALEPSKRLLNGRVCYRGDAAMDESGNLAPSRTLSALRASIVAADAALAFGTFVGNKVTAAEAVKAYLQTLLKSLTETWIRPPTAPGVAERVVQRGRNSEAQKASDRAFASLAWTSRSRIALANAARGSHKEAHERMQC